MLPAFGVAVEELDDGLDITGGAALTCGPGSKPRRPPDRDGGGDARTERDRDLAQVGGFDAVDTSYPSFLDDLRRCAPDALAG